MADGRLQVVGVGICAWSSAFLLTRLLLPKRSHDFCNRTVSLIHVAVSLLLSSRSVQNWRCLVSPLASPPSPLQMQTMTVSLSYFIYDFFCCLLDTRVDYTNVFHHIMSIWSLAYGVFYVACGTELVTCLWLSELSNPFMHGRELLKELGMKDTRLSLVNDICFAVVFILARLGLGPYVTYVTVFADNPLFVKIGGCGIQTVSIFWSYKIARMAYFKFLRRKKD
eukprot:c24107_g2_i1 orf=399-1070(+)